MAISRGASIVLGVVILAIGFAIGFLIGYIGLSSKTATLGLAREADNTISKKLLDEINANNIRENLRKLTEHPHLAGTPADFDQADELKNLWEEQGLKAWLTPYKVLLSYPDENNPNRIELQDGSGTAVYTTQLKEKILRPEQDQPDVVPPFNAFSAPGTPKGPMVYVNYGRVEDFIWLKEQKNMDFSGKICIARYGKIFRGDKAKIAERYGCSGMILYTDPKDYNQASMGNVYPESWWMPPTGVQRGTVKASNGGTGDPLTPGYPSIESAYRLNESDAELLTIPVHPISYGDAQKLLEHMAGEEVPEDWKGTLPITYRLGPGFQDSQWKVQMLISTRTKRVTTYNAFGMIEGELEPDRYVLVGNHRDAWVYGAVDPSSGTAAMMELSRALGKLVKQGWKPRRSIVFCSWGAEEYGLVGSREWVEQYTSLLAERAVAYINVDIAVQGNFTMRAKALPLIKDTLYEVAKKIPNPDVEEVAAGRPMLYDTWRLRYKELDDNNQPTGKPKIPILGSGSDYAPFITKVGVTCVDLRYHYDERLGISSYPLYHSVYETFHLVNDIIDPGFLLHKAVTQFWGELARTLADEYILPYDARNYVESLVMFKARLEGKYREQMLQNGLQDSLKYLQDAIDNMKIAADDFQERLQSVDIQNPMQVRMMNDQLMSLERVFIDPNGLPGRPFTRNVVFAPSAHNSYSGSSFPGIVDTLFGIEKLSGQEAVERWEQVKKEMSIVTLYIDTATAMLKDYSSFQFS